MSYLTYFGLRHGNQINGIAQIRNIDSSWATLIRELGLLGILILLRFVCKVLQDGTKFIKYNCLWFQENKRVKILFYITLLQIAMKLMGTFTSGVIMHRPWSICFYMAIVYSVIYKQRRSGEEKLHEVPEI